MLEEFEGHDDNDDDIRHGHHLGVHSGFDLRGEGIERPCEVQVRGKKVTYVTKSGKTLTDDEVRTRINIGSPVRVQYGTEGDAKVISRGEIDD